MVYRNGRYGEQEVILRLNPAAAALAVKRWTPAS
jgi:hypothetical protein